MDNTKINSEVFDYTWKQYRKWAATSRKQKASITMWRILVLLLMVVGAICGAISSQLDLQAVVQTEMQAIHDEALSFTQLVSYFGAIALALAAFFSTQALSRDREQRWILSRSIAEACKSELFKYRVAAVPYNTKDRDSSLRKHVDRVVGKAGQISPLVMSDEDLLADINRQPLNEQDYIKERVEQQRENYYLKNAKKNATIMSWGRVIGICLGAIAAVLSSLANTPLGDLTTNWIAVTSTATAAFTAFLFSGRYNYLALSYQTTADRLEQILIDWNLEKTEKGAAADFNSYVTEFENAISIENNAWVAEYKKTATADNKS